MYNSYKYDKDIIEKHKQQLQLRKENKQKILREEYSKNYKNKVISFINKIANEPKPLPDHLVDKYTTIDHVNLLDKSKVVKEKYNLQQSVLMNRNKSFASFDSDGRN